MRRIFLPALVFAALLPAASAQKITATAPLAATAAAPASLEDRRKALSALLGEYWDAALEHSPEFASAVGDARFNDKLSDYSPRAANLWIEREQELLMRLAAIDPAGFSASEAASRDTLLTQFTNDITDADAHPWETPIDTGSDLFAAYTGLPDELPFATVQDYDNWTARLRALPAVLDQTIANMGSGIDEHHVPAKAVLVAALAELKQIAAQKPEESSFADPLKQFPASISAAEQQRIQDETLAVIGKRVLPAYQRVARFLEVSYIPAAPEQAAGGQSAAATADAAQSLTWQSRQGAILALRDKAQDKLGSRFSLKSFHDELVSAGPLLPPDLLEKSCKCMD